MNWWSDRAVLKGENGLVEKVASSALVLFLVYSGDGFILSGADDLEGRIPIAVFTKQKFSKWKMLKLSEGLDLQPSRDIKFALGLKRYSFFAKSRFFTRLSISVLAFAVAVLSALFISERYQKTSGADAQVQAVQESAEKTLIEDVYHWLETGDIFQAQMSSRELRIQFPQSSELRLLEGEIAKRKANVDGVMSSDASEKLLADADKFEAEGRAGLALKNLRAWLEEADQTDIRTKDYGTIKDKVKTLEMELGLLFEKWRKEIDALVNAKKNKGIGRDDLHTLVALLKDHEHCGLAELGLEKEKEYLERLKSLVAAIVGDESAAISIVEQYSGCQKALSLYQGLASDLSGFDGGETTSVTRAVERCSKELN